MNPTVIQVKVTPRAKKARMQEEIQADGSILYRVYVTAVPEDGKANEAVIRLLASFFHVPKSAITIHKGQGSRDKVIWVYR